MKKTTARLILLVRNLGTVDRNLSVGYSVIALKDESKSTHESCSQFTATRFFPTL